MSTRLDVFLAENGYAESRSKAQELIKNGCVCVNGKTVAKSSQLVEAADGILIATEGICPYVSRGGLKLQAALDVFHIDVKGKVCIDIGASTGGFTDCLLKRGAKRVYAIDSGSTQLHSSLLCDERVISMENTNARYLCASDLPEKADIAVMDVSFISQTKLYPSLSTLIESDGLFITLIKPQFEVGRGSVGKGGIVKDRRASENAVKNVILAASGYGFTSEGIIDSPIKGGDGNTEYLAVFQYKPVTEGVL